MTGPAFNRADAHDERLADYYAGEPVRSWELEAVPEQPAAPSVGFVSEQGEPFQESLPDPLPPVPAFDADLLPESVRAWCEDVADGLQVPLDFTAVPAVIGLAAAIGRTLAVALRRNGRWYEAPVLWGGAVGRPSTAKTPSMAPARRMLERLEAEARDRYDSELRIFEARAMVAKASKANAADKIKAAVRKGNMMEAEAAADAALYEDEAPSEPRLVVNDATVEKLGELLNANPRGLVQFRDELAGWLATLDREGREGDRAFWLESWNGQGGFTVDRIGRGTVRIEACAMWNLGGVQPGKLEEYVRGAVRGGFSDDGLVQRFQLLVYPDVPSTWRYTDRAPNPAAEAKAWATFKRLRHLTPEGVHAETAPDCAMPFLRLSDDAQEQFKDWQTALMQRLRAGNEPPHMESHLGKFPALAGRLALVLHLADGGTGPVTAAAMSRALRWCDYLEGHARRIYAPAADGGIAAAHALLKKRAALPILGFTARDVYRKGWAGLSDAEVVGQALDVLTEYGYLHPIQEDTGGRPTVTYVWRDA